MIKAGGGTRGHDAAMLRLAEVSGAAVVLSPGSTGVLPDAHPQNMHVGGSKGSISGNYAMAEADLLIVIGSRAVCQADCSGIGYKKAQAVININGDLADALHYNKTTALVGDIGVLAERLAARLELWESRNNKSDWLEACAAKKTEWTAYKARAICVPAVARSGVAAPGAGAAGGNQGRRRFRQVDRCRQVLRCRRRTGQRLPDRRGRPHAAIPSPRPARPIWALR